MLIKRILFFVFLLSGYQLYGQGLKIPDYGPCENNPSPRECVDKAISEMKKYLLLPHSKKKIGWGNLVTYHFQSAAIEFKFRNYREVFSILKISGLYIDSLRSLAPKTDNDVSELTNIKSYLEVDFCSRLSSIDSVIYNVCECQNIIEAYYKDQSQKNDYSNEQENLTTNESILKEKSEPVQKEEDELKNGQNQNFEKKQLETINKETVSKQKSRYDAFLCDSLGRLKIDSTLTIGVDELRQLKDNRLYISASMVNALYEYEQNEQTKKLLNSNYNLNKLPYQIKDTTKHLYTIRCDSGQIVSIEHTLLSSNMEYGLYADSLIRKSIPSLFPYLKIKDEKIHEFLIPVIYIPFRYRIPNKTFFYCNCQFQSEQIAHVFLPCENNNEDEMKVQPFKSGLLKPNGYCIFDEYYFVIAEGKDMSIVPSPVYPEKIQVSSAPMKRKSKRKKSDRE